MTLAYTILDTLNFAKRLEAVGVESKVAEVQAELQQEILEKQAQAYEKVVAKFSGYLPVLDEIKITKHEFATKGDVNSLRYDLTVEINRLEGKMDNMRNELIIKLGGVIVASSTVLGVIMAFLVK